MAARLTLKVISNSPTIIVETSVLDTCLTHTVMQISKFIVLCLHVSKVITRISNGIHNMV